jgi:hypothetical protein
MWRPEYSDAEKNAESELVNYFKRERKSEYVALSPSFYLSELKRGDGYGQATCGRPPANPLDEAPQGQVQESGVMPISEP